MSPQVALSFESLPTAGADERPRVCVYELMRLEVHFRFERLVTELALEGGVFPLLVAQQVVLVSLRMPEFSGTLAAGENLPFFVSVHVLHEMELPAEAFVTNFTYKCPPSPLYFCFLSILDVRDFGSCCVRCVTCSV